MVCICTNNAIALIAINPILLLAPNVVCCTQQNNRSRMNQQLANFYDHLNTAVITTNDFQEGTLFRKREKVSQFAYCGLNPVYRKYLSFDLDYPQAGRKFEELKIPPLRLSRPTAAMVMLTIYMSS